MAITRPTPDHLLLPHGQARRLREGLYFKNEYPAACCASAPLLFHSDIMIVDGFCFVSGGFNFPFACDQKKSFWRNTADLHKIIQRRMKMLDNSGPDMEYFNPTLIDAFFNLAPYIKNVPNAFNKTENLSAFASDKKNAALKISNDIVSKLPGLTTTNLGRLDFSEVYGNLRLVPYNFS